ncbi:MAG: metallophosphoesterase [Clostridia bacterium]|nr:metallophosphoesterase [Clostridia bacterium]
MKTIVVFSDSHYDNIPERLKSVANEADFVFFCGDGVARLGDLLFHKGLVAVKGNCDDAPFPREQVIDIEGVKCLITHGDLYGVKSDLLPLYYRARELGCRLVCYGHTHYAKMEKVEDITFINPGAIHSPIASQPSYAYIVINGNQITEKLVNIY